MSTIISRKMAHLTSLLRTTLPKISNTNCAVATTNRLRKNNYFTYTNSLTQPLNRSPKVCSADEALSQLESGKRK